MNNLILYFEKRTIYLRRKLFGFQTKQSRLQLRSLLLFDCGGIYKEERETEQGAILFLTSFVLPSIFILSTFHHEAWEWLFKNGGKYPSKSLATSSRLAGNHLISDCNQLHLISLLAAGSQALKYKLITLRRMVAAHCWSLLCTFASWFLSLVWLSALP